MQYLLYVRRIEPWYKTALHYIMEELSCNGEVIIADLCFLQVLLHLSLLTDVHTLIQMYFRY